MTEKPSEFSTLYDALTEDINVVLKPTIVLSTNNITYSSIDVVYMIKKAKGYVYIGVY